MQSSQVSISPKRDQAPAPRRGGAACLPRTPQSAPGHTACPRHPPCPPQNSRGSGSRESLPTAAPHPESPLLFSPYSPPLASQGPGLNLASRHAHGPSFQGIRWHLEPVAQIGVGWGVSPRWRLPCEQAARTPVFSASLYPRSTCPTHGTSSVNASRTKTLGIHPKQSLKILPVSGTHECSNPALQRTPLQSFHFFPSP